MDDLWTLTDAELERCYHDTNYEMGISFDQQDRILKVIKFHNITRVIQERYDSRRRQVEYIDDRLTYLMCNSSWSDAADVMRAILLPLLRRHPDKMCFGVYSDEDYGVQAVWPSDSMNAALRVDRFGEMVEGMVWNDTEERGWSEVFDPSDLVKDPAPLERWLEKHVRSR